MRNKTNDKIMKKVFINAFTSTFIGILISFLIWYLNPSRLLMEGETKIFLMYCFVLITPVIFFIGLHFILNIKVMYSWLFEHRWMVALFLILFTTVLKLHGDSISYYMDTIQPGIGSGFGYPIFGNYRPIRSDEFLVNTPAVLASTYGENAFGVHNEILRGTSTLNIINGVYGGIVTLICAPWKLAYLVLPTEYAFSFHWYTPIVLGFMACLEMFYIITKKNKLVSFCGASLIIFSAFYQWWTPSPYYIGGPGTIACLYYFIHSNNTWKKCGLSFLMVICFGMFVTNLYPAWQVPFGYVFLVIGIWLIYDNWDSIRHLKKLDWFILGVALLICIALIGLYFLSIQEYVKVIGQTVYPGARFETGHDSSLRMLFYYVYAPFFAVKDFYNPCEYGMFMSLFPLPSLAAFYCMLKEKRKDILTGGLLLVETAMIIFIAFGFPHILSALTLFFVSLPKRMVGIIGFIQVLLITILLSQYQNTLKMNKIFAAIIAACNTILAIYYPLMDFPDYLNIDGFQWGKYIRIGIIFIIFSYFAYGLIVKSGNRRKTIYISFLTLFTIITGLMVRPISAGLSAITSKPIYHQIQEIVSLDSHAKWITSGGSPIFPSYSVASGAPTIDSVNIYPNLELWEKLDPNGTYENVYNRFAHIQLIFTEEDTSFELNQEDYFTLRLSYKDIEKTQATYLLANEGFLYQEENGYITLEPLYSEGGATIYRIQYI